MARNRQRAKERQARRKAGQSGGGEGAAPRKPDAASTPDPTPDPAESRPDPILGSAPPQDLGHAEEVLNYEQELDAEHASDQEHFDVEQDHTDDGDVLFPEERKGKRRPRLIEFLISVQAELKRVEWPDRQALMTLTGVVLGFVLIAGSYLGLLDAVAQKLVNAII
jgi:preprotein translocase SecE subunit